MKPLTMDVVSAARETYKAIIADDAHPRGTGVTVVCDGELTTFYTKDLARTGLGALDLVDSLRAALAAAEAKLADERKHADALAEQLTECLNLAEWPATKHSTLQAHAARRNAEKEASNDRP